MFDQGYFPSGYFDEYWELSQPQETPVRRVQTSTVIPGGTWMFDLQDKEEEDILMKIIAAYLNV